MEEEVLSEENSSILKESKKDKSSKILESHKDTITITDTDMDNSVPFTATKKSIPVINLNTEVRQGSRNDPLTDRS
jgi:hypothetical protein